MKWKLTVHRFVFNYLSKSFFRLRHINPRHRSQLSIIRFVPKYLDQTLVNFSASPPWDWQTGCLWWEVVESRFRVDLKSNFALKNNSMEFLLDPITRWIHVLYESRINWTWHHSKLAVEEVSFFGGLKSGTPSTTVKWGNFGRWGNFGQYKIFILSNIFCHLKNNVVVDMEVKGYLKSVICFKRSFIRLDPVMSLL